MSSPRSLSGGMCCFPPTKQLHLLERLPEPCKRGVAINVRVSTKKVFVRSSNKYLFQFISRDERLSAEEYIGQVGDNLREDNKHGQANDLNGNKRNYSFIDIAHGVLRWRHALEIKQGISKRRS